MSTGRHSHASNRLSLMRYNLFLAIFFIAVIVAMVGWLFVLSWGFVKLIGFV
jgi:hypothetical protein